MAGSRRVEQSTGSDGSTHRTRPSVCVVGVGTVGLHEALAFAKAGYETVGYDVDRELIAAYRQGIDPSGVVDASRLTQTECSFTTDPASVEAADYVLIAVPTATAEGDPTMATVEAAAETVGHHFCPGTTVVLVSTVYPGATAEVFVPALESTSGLTAGTDFSVAHAPVRLSPHSHGSTVIPDTRLVGADSAAVAADVAAQFETVVDTVHVVDGTQVAAAAKCVENAQRDVNIALMNELSRLLGAMDIDARTVFEAAGTKWNFHQYDPGVVGGTCVPVAPQLILERARQAGATPELLNHARAVNDRMHRRVAETTALALEQRADRHAIVGEVEPAGQSTARDAERPTVLALGLSYKADSSSLEATPSKPVIGRLEELGARVVGYDPLVDATAAADSLDIQVVPEADEVSADAVLVLVGHKRFESLTVDDLRAATNQPFVLVDLPGLFDAADEPDIIYRSVGDVS